MAVLKTNAGTWEVRFRVQGRQKQKTFRNYRAAVAFDEKTKTQLRDGDYVAPSDITVETMMEKFLEAGKTKGVTKKPKPWKEQMYQYRKNHAENYIIPRFGEKKATSLKPVEIEIAGGEWAKSVSPTMVNKVFDTFTAAYSFAGRKLGVKYNPMLDVERLASQVTAEQMEAEALGAVPDRGEDEPEANSGVLRAIRADEVYSALELKQLIEAAKQGLEKILIMLAIFTGLRHGELNGLRWSVIDFKKARLFVNRSLTQLKGGAVLEKPKTHNAYRYIKLPPVLLSELRHWKLQCPPSPNGFVLVDELGNPMNRKKNNQALAECAKRAGVRVLSMNNLRHSFASQQLIAGTPVLEVSKLMGHSDPSVTLKVYSRWAEREQSRAELALAERIFGAVEQQEAAGSE